MAQLLFFGAVNSFNLVGTPKTHAKRRAYLSSALYDVTVRKAKLIHHCTTKKEFWGYFATLRDSSRSLARSKSLPTCYNRLVHIVLSKNVQLTGDKLARWEEYFYVLANVLSSHVDMMLR